MNLITILTRLISVIAAVIMLYQVLVALFSLIRLKKAPTASRWHRFAVVIAARNEQSVIGNLLDSLNRQNYPRDAFSIFVIADNCTDHTAQIAQAKGARVYCRQDAYRIGKGFALNWFFDLFRAAYPHEFDAIAIFDADNLVDPDFLAVMNDRLCAGEYAVMGYRDAKNPYDSWVSACYAITFWFNSRFYMQSREKIGLSALAGGTGYVFRAEWINCGWHTRTISEDLEFSIQQMACGRRVAYEPRARFYDEQPVSLGVSLRQRLRWASGCYQNIRQTLPVFLRKVSWQNLPLLLDCLFFLFTMPVVSIQMLSVVPQFLAVYLQPVALRYPYLLSLLVSGALGLGLLYGQIVLALLLERKFSPRILGGLLLFPVFLLSNSLLYLIALIKPDLAWHPIAHHRSVGLEKIDRS